VDAIFRGAEIAPSQHDKGLETELQAIFTPSNIPEDIRQQDVNDILIILYHTEIVKISVRQSRKNEGRQKLFADSTNCNYR
jgi:ABC-type branched-subunit amino acid transport system substrate-binding protein